MDEKRHCENCGASLAYNPGPFCRPCRTTFVRVANLAASAGISEEQIENQIGSGKLRALSGGWVRPAEARRWITLRDLDGDFYFIDEGGDGWVNSRYAAYRMTRALERVVSQKQVSRLVRRGALEGRKMGNALEVRTSSLQAFVGQELKASNRAMASVKWPGDTAK